VLAELAQLQDRKELAEAILFSELLRQRVAVAALSLMSAAAAQAAPAAAALQAVLHM